MSIFSLEKKVKVLRALDTVSFDVFDTVLFRRHGSWNDFLFDLAGSMQGAGLLTASLSAEDFVTIRLNAERLAHKHSAEKGIYALPLEKTYDVFPELYIMPGVTAAQLAQHEFEHELANAFAVPGMIDAINGFVASGLRVCFTTNTYYSKAQITRMLRHIGFPESSLALVFCSCEYGTPKQRDLFKEILNVLRVPAGNVLHCGDNEKIDGEAAEAHGLKTSPYREMFDGWMAEGEAPDSRGMTVALRRCGRFDPDRAPFKSFGYVVLGPIVAGFSKWLIDLAQETGRQHMLFAEREGIFFRKAVDLFLEADPDGNAAGLSTSLISVSRKAVTPLLHSGGSLDLKIDAYKRQTRLGIDPDRLITDPQAETNVRGYLGQAIKTPGKSLFVDIGYKGTINRYLNSFLDETGREKLLGAYLFHSGDRENADGCSRGYLSEYDEPVPILHHSMKGISFLEQCFMPALGSVTGYDDRLEPLREMFRLDREQVQQQLDIQEGILAFLRDLLRICQTTGIALADVMPSRESQITDLLNLFNTPTSHVQNLAVSWKHEVNFGTNAIMPVSAASYIDIAGASLEMVRGGVGWSGVLWNHPPFSSPDEEPCISTAYISYTTNRGPGGPGNVETAHSGGAAILTYFLEAAENEQLMSVRVSELSFRDDAQDIVLSLYAPQAQDTGSARTNLDLLLRSDSLTRVSLVWSKTTCHIRSDTHSYIKAVKVEDDSLLILFSEHFTSHTVLLKLEEAL